jgi:uncharacterized protein (UPF0332 family)
LTAAELFDKAQVALKSAEILLGAGDFDCCANRAYYAMFDAARAALFATAGAEHVLAIKSHSGLISFFSQRLVKTGSVSIAHGKSLNKVEDLRLVADYRGDALDAAQALWALEQARIFVAALLALQGTKP